MIAIISFVLLFPFVLKTPESSQVVGILIFILASFFSFLLLTLLDINDPFDGYWQVKIDSFSSILRQLEDETANTTPSPHLVRSDGSQVGVSGRAG